MEEKFTWSRRGAVLAIVLLFAQVLSSNVDPKKGRVTDNPTSGNRYTLEQEVQVGRQAIPEIEKQLQLLPPDHPLSRYVSQLGQSLAYTKVLWGIRGIEDFDSLPV